MPQHNKESGAAEEMDTTKDDKASGLQKSLTSKKTLAIIYAMLVIAFAVGLVVTDADAVDMPTTAASHLEIMRQLSNQ